MEGNVFPAKKKTMEEILPPAV